MDLRTLWGIGNLGPTESSTDIYTLPNVKYISSGRHNIAQGDQLGAFVMI